MSVFDNSYVTRTRTADAAPVLGIGEMQVVFGALPKNAHVSSAPTVTMRRDNRLHALELLVAGAAAFLVVPFMMIAGLTDSFRYLFAIGLPLTMVKFLADRLSRRHDRAITVNAPRISSKLANPWATVSAVPRPVPQNGTRPHRALLKKLMEFGGTAQPQPKMRKNDPAMAI